MNGSDERPILPTGWEWKSLGGLCEKPQYGFTSKAASTGSLKFLRTTDIAHGPINWEEVPFCAQEPTEPQRYLLGKGDIVISRSGSVGVSAVVTDPPRSVFASYLIRFRAKERVIDPRLLALYLQSPGYWQEIRRLASGIGMNNVNAKKLSSIPIPVPPRSEQAEIVHRLEACSSSADQAEGLLLQALRQCEALQGQVVNLAARGPSSRLLGECLTEPMKNGRSVGTASGGFPVLRLTALKEGHVDLSEVKGGDWTPEDARSYLVRAGDFLVARGNGSLRLVGRGGVVPDSPDPVAFPDTLIRLRIDGRLLRNEYLRLIWDSHAVRRQIESRARTTAGIYKINQSDLSAVEIPVPSLEEQDALIARARPRLEGLRSMREGLEAACSRNSDLWRSILRQAFVGGLSAEEAVNS